ncbi:hypothetical protein I4U23_000155 [Adineta vaga]|nr:hypothetical protein I4U23_000155 [Adineta vaga]
MNKFNAEEFMSKLYTNANPLLNTFRNDNVSIQPYFVLALQFVFSESCQRIWNRFIYKTWSLPIELISFERDKYSHRYSKPKVSEKTRSLVNSFPTVYIFQEWKNMTIKTKKMRKIPTFDIFDICFSALPLIAHTIWYCYAQASCLSASNAHVWDCYNLFGYRLYNYIFSGYAEFTLTFLSKLILFYQNYDELKRRNRRKQSWRRFSSRIIFYLSLISSSVTFLFIGSLILPYFITNIIPMIFIYLFVLIIYIYILTVIIIFIKYFTFFPRIQMLSYELLLNQYHRRRRIGIQIGIKLLPTILLILFNLSQYFYYESDYWKSITKEIDSRSEDLYFYRVGYSPEQIFHTILTAL